MKYKLSQAMGLVFAGFLAMAPISLAAATTSERPVGPSGTLQMQHPSTSPEMQRGEKIHATVERVDTAKHTVELKATDGNRVELPAPSQMLTELKPGDMVEISIHKTSEIPEQGQTTRPEHGSSSGTLQPGTSR